MPRTDERTRVAIGECMNLIELLLHAKGIPKDVGAAVTEVLILRVSSLARGEGQPVIATEEHVAEFAKITGTIRTAP